LKRCEQHLQRAATDDAFPEAKVLATEISVQDTGAELEALKTTTKAQDAKIKALSAQLRGDTSGAKRGCNGVAFSLPVSQALHPRLKEQMPCSPYSPQMDRATLFQFVARISSPHVRTDR